MPDLLVGCVVKVAFEDTAGEPEPLFALTRGDTVKAIPAALPINRSRRDTDTDGSLLAWVGVTFFTMTVVS